jgi:hypothetical protein
MDLQEPELMVLRKGFARVMTAAEIIEHWTAPERDRSNDERNN